MLTKTKIALSTLLVVGFASAALADGTPENRIGDRYPALEQAAQHSNDVSAFASTVVLRPAKGVTAAEQTLLDRAKGYW